MSQVESATLPPKCNICNIVFSQRKNLLRHNRSFHEERKFDIRVLTKSGQTASFEVESGSADDVDLSIPDNEEQEVYEEMEVDGNIILPNDGSGESNGDVEQTWEEQEDSGETHYCTSCNIHITSVVDHVAEFHPHQTIYYETGGTEDDEPEVTEIEVAPVAVDQSEDQELEEYEEEYLVEEEEETLDTNDTTSLEFQEVENEQPLYTNYTKTNILRDKLLKSPTKENSSAKPQRKYNKTPIVTARLPKIIGTLGKTNEVDPVSGVKYVRKVMKIEKFWEDESFQLPPIKDSEKEGSSSQGAKRKRPAAIKSAKNIQVNRKIVNVKNQIDKITRSGSGTVKSSLVMKTEAPEETLEPVEVTAQSDPLDEDREAREAIIKILQDDNSEDMSIVYVCQKCEVEFDNMNSVKTHKCKLKRSGIRLTCEICGLKCKSQRRLQTHENTHDPFYKEKLQMKRLERKISSCPIICSVCNTQFSTEVGFRMHMKMHRPDNVQKVAEMNNKIEYRCDLCQMTCYSERTLRIHYKVHFPYNEPTVEELRSRVSFTTNESLLACKLCFMAFEDNDALKEHWLTHATSETVVSEEAVPTGDVATEETVISIQIDNQQTQDFFTCGDCGNILSESYREIHEKMHRGELHYVCTTCNRKFPCQEHLELHVRIHEPKDLECGQCKKKFTDQTLLAAHISKHTAVERPYPCGFCGKCFSRPHEKVKHERVHTGEQPYECNICGMRFRVAYCLRMHERIHTGVRPYGCEYCEKTFRTRSGYKQHVSIHSDLRQYQCKFCPKSFKTIVQLAGHRKSHTKPYICADCNRRFATSYMLRAHMANHANQQLSSLKHKCTECGASYGREYALRDHLKAAHGKVMAYPNKRKGAAAQAEFEASSNDVENDNDSSQEAVYLAIE